MPASPGGASAARRCAAGWTGAALLAVGLAGAGCHPNDPVYFPAAVSLESDGSGTEVIATVPLRFRAPSDAEQMERDKLGGELGYPIPWLREDRIHVEVRYTITNLGPPDRPGMFSLFVDGASEYTRFDFQAVADAFEAADEDAPPVGLIQASNTPILEPGQVFQGVVREDDFHEASIDLDGMGRFMAPLVAVLINRSEVNPVGLEMVPSAPSSDLKPAPPVKWILPALWEVTLRFSSNQPMTCQFLVRVRDDDQRLWEDGDSEFQLAPTTFTPEFMP